MTTEQAGTKQEVPNGAEQFKAEASPPKRVTEEDAVGEIVAILDRVEADGVSSLSVISRVALRKGIKFIDVMMNGLEAGFEAWAKKA